MDCTKNNCSFFHPRSMKKSKDDESTTLCKFKNECNRKECKYIHPEKVKESSKKDENDTNAKIENKDKDNTVINADSVPNENTSNQVFHKGKEDSSQITELRSMILEMSKNVNTLMQERANLYWTWGQHQYYQQ